MHNHVLRFQPPNDANRACCSLGYCMHGYPSMRIRACMSLRPHACTLPVGACVCLNVSGIQKSTSPFFQSFSSLSSASVCALLFLDVFGPGACFCSCRDRAAGDSTLHQPAIGLSRHHSPCMHVNSAQPHVHTQLGSAHQYAACTPPVGVIVHGWQPILTQAEDANLHNIFL